MLTPQLLAKVPKHFWRLRVAKNLVLQLTQKPIMFALTNGLYNNYHFSDVLQLCILQDFFFIGYGACLKMVCHSLLLIFPVLGRFSPFQVFQALTASLSDKKHFCKSRSFWQWNQDRQIRQFLRAELLDVRKCGLGTLVCRSSLQYKGRLHDLLEADFGESLLFPLGKYRWREEMWAEEFMIFPWAAGRVMTKPRYKTDTIWLLPSLQAG